MRVAIYHKNNKEYIVSEDGKIWSNTSKKYMKHSIDKAGYVQSSIGHLHRILAICFIEKPNNKNEVNHKDGNKLNNNLSNLEWVNRKENILHGINNNLYSRVKINSEIANNIRNEYIPYKVTLNFLSKKYNLSERTIRDILNYKSWKN